MLGESVHVLNLEGDAYRGLPQGFSAEAAALGPLFRQHDNGVPDHNFGVRDTPMNLETHSLSGPESLLVEFDGFGGVFERQDRHCDGADSGHWFGYGCHGWFPSQIGFQTCSKTRTRQTAQLNRDGCQRGYFRICRRQASAGILQDLLHHRIELFGQTAFSHSSHQTSLRLASYASSFPASFVAFAPGWLRNVAAGVPAL